MNTNSKLHIASNTINIIIFFYLSLSLIKINALDMIGLSISGFGILASLIADIIGALNEN